MPTPRLSFLFAGIAALSFASGAWAQGVRLDFAEKVRLLDCSPAASSPAFSLKANIVDADGAPVGLALPPQEQLPQHITVVADNMEITPFYASAGSDASQRRERVVMILVDASGSMLQRMESGRTRYDAAQAAVLRFLEGFEESSDQVSVVPFESHQVLSKIRNGRFSSSLAEAQQQVSQLPTPEITNNTALYSAVDTALDVLMARAGSGDVETLLVVMTDGRNDIRAGDDLGLLRDEGLAPVAEKVANSGVEVVAVGLGNAQSIDTAAMERISTRFYLVRDEQALSRVFSFTREMLLNRLNVTFLSPWADRASLAGKNLPVSMKLALPNGQEYASTAAVWSAPQMGTPVFEGRCGPAELKAVLKDPGQTSSSGWWPVVRPLLVLFGIGAVLLAMWFWIPRLIWPEQYIGDAPVVASRGRWASSTGVRREGARAPGGAPQGFTDVGRDQGGPSRMPGDKTVVMPRTPGGPGTRTRLG